MGIRLGLQISTYLLVVDGLAALALAGLLEPRWWPFVILVVAASWWQEAVRARVSAMVRHHQLLMLLAVGFFALDLAYLAESLLDGFVHVLLFALFYKLFTRRALRDSRDLLLLSFFMLVGASTLTVSVGFLLILMVFLLVGMCALGLYHMSWESEHNAADPGHASLESQRLVTPSLLGMSVAAAFASMLFTLAFFFIIPRVGQATLPLRARLDQPVSGFSERVELGSFETIQTDGTVVMRVQFPEGPAAPERLGGLRWRGVAFDRFNGREWSVSRPGRRVFPAVFGGRVTLARPSGTGPVVTQEIYLEPLGTEVLFAAPRLLTVVLSAGSLSIDEFGSVSSPVPQARLHYQVLSELEPPASRSRGTERPLSFEEHARYLQLPPLSPRVHALARELTRGTPDQWAAALRLTQYLQTSFRYSLDLTRASSLEPLEDFLFLSRSGNCEYFATSLAVFLRSLEIPARVVNGFQRGEWNPYGGYFAVRQRDAHSWVEAYFPERGWVSLDPSPRGELDASRASSAAFQYLDALRMRWHRYMVSWSLGDQLRASASVRQQALNWRRVIFEGGLAMLGNLRAVAIAGIAAGVLALAVVVWRRGLGLTVVRLRPPAPVLVYERMLKRLARLGLRPGPAETAREFCERVIVRLPDRGEVLRELTRVYEKVRFGGATIAQEELARLWKLAEGLTAEPRGHATS